LVQFGSSFIAVEVPKRRGALKNVIALMGTSKRGKSQTIRTVVEMLTAKYPEAKIEHNHTTKAEIRIVLTVNGLKIGIESQGDPSGRLIRESLDLFVKIGCDLIICATRTSGATKNRVDALHSQGFDVHWLEQQPQSQPYEQILRSLAMAREIVEKFEVLLEATATPRRSLAARA
jgi:hypothetical protein